MNYEQKTFIRWLQKIGKEEIIYSLCEDGKDFDMRKT